MNKLAKQAFTLIELLVVIAIIGILSGLIVISMNGMTTKATIAKAQAFSNSLKNSLMLNLVSEWRFDDLTTAGDNAVIKDYWSGGNNGTLDTNLSATDTADKLKTDCVFGKCLSFDGIDDYISVNDNTSLNPGIGDITLAAWVYPLTQPSNAGRIFFKVVTSPALEGYSFSINPSGYTGGYIAENGTSKSVYANKTLVKNGWHYVVFSIDRDNANGIKIYIDGVEESYSTQENPTTISGNITPVTSLNIGRNSVDASASYFNGKIDDLRLYNAAMPTSQIKEQYYAGLNGLLTGGSITKEEYQDRIGELAMIQP